MVFRKKCVSTPLFIILLLLFASCILTVEEARGYETRRDILCGF